jgi:hypothetical protein
MELDQALIREINQIGYWTARKMMVENGLYSLTRYKTGALVVIDTIGEQINDITVEPDQVFMGNLIDAQKALIEISGASYHRELVGFTIALGTITDVMSPGGTAPACKLRTCIGPKRDMAYARVDNTGLVLPPNDNYVHIAGKYGRLQIDDEIIFDRLEPGTMR